MTRALRPRDGRVDDGTLPVHIEQLSVPDFDAVGTATSLLPPPQAYDPATRAQELVAELVRCAPDDEAMHWPALLPLGQHALVALVQRFPGPLWFDPRRPYVKLPRGRQVSAIAATLVAFGSASVPYLAWLMASESSDVRCTAALVARDLPCPELLEPLGNLLLHADPATRRAALDVLPDFAALPAFARTLAGLRAAVSDPLTAQTWRLRAMHALAELRDVASIRPLIEALGDKDRSIARAAHVALRSLTGHDLGTMRLAWSRWFRHHGQEDRVEWLIAGLADLRTDVRTLAAEELAHLTGRRASVSATSDRSVFLSLQDEYRRYVEEQRVRQNG
jgi:hypothetical protein